MKNFRRGFEKQRHRQSSRFQRNCCLAEAICHHCQDRIRARQAQWLKRLPPFVLFPGLVFLQPAVRLDVLLVFLRLRQSVSRGLPLEFDNNQDEFH